MTTDQRVQLIAEVAAAIAGEVIARSYWKNQAYGTAAMNEHVRSVADAAVVAAKRIVTKAENSAA